MGKDLGGDFCHFLGGLYKVLMMPLEDNTHQAAYGERQRNTLIVCIPGKHIPGHHALFHGKVGSPFHKDTAQAAAIQCIQKILALKPEMKILIQFTGGGVELILPAAELEIHHGMIQQGVEGPVFAGKVTIERFTGDLAVSTQIADGNILILIFQHQLK